MLRLLHVAAHSEDRGAFGHRAVSAHGVLHPAECRATDKRQRVGRGLHQSGRRQRRPLGPAPQTAKTGQCLGLFRFATLAQIALRACLREDNMADNQVPRRSFLKGAGAAGAVGATALTAALSRSAEAQTAAAPVQQPAPQPEPLLTLTATEAAFLSAAYDTIIPADALSPSGTDCGLVTYIDR